MRQPTPACSARDRWLLPVLRATLVPAQVGALLEAAPSSLWEHVVGAGWLSDETLLDAAARALRLPVARIEGASPSALELVDERWARRWRVLPLAADERHLDVATADPLDIECERALAFASARTVRFHLASPIGLGERIDRSYRAGAALLALADAPEVQHLNVEPDAVLPSDGAELDGAAATRLVDRLLGEAVAARVSDLHVEPEEQGIAVRHRIDGVLRLVHTLPRGALPALVSRMKIVSGLDIADRLRPQDGRARVAVNGRPVDLRVSTLPASHGEKVVVRVLDAGATVLGLDAMGFGDEALVRVERLLEAREGLVLVTGPTGSGKTTTLYAALRQIQRRGVNVVTVEDPVEYRLPGVVQVQVRERSGLSFATALRSIMRQDPDVILVGEIRDRETAEIAIQASLTGHLVLSTLHTNDAASAVTRLVDVGVAPHKLATAVKGVIAQRLLRRICPECAERGEPPAAAARFALPAGATLAHAVGCARCGGTGYRGRMAVVEVLLATSAVERLVAQGAAAERIAEAARGEGMRTLWDAGLAHVLAGATTLDELLRVAEPPAAAPVIPVPARELPATAARAVVEPPARGERQPSRAVRATLRAYRRSRAVARGGDDSRPRGHAATHEATAPVERSGGSGPAP